MNIQEKIKIRLDEIGIRRDILKSEILYLNNDLAITQQTVNDKVAEFNGLKIEEDSLYNIIKEDMIIDVKE